MQNNNRDIKRIKKVYRGMNDRCTYPSHKSWKNYGEKGIRVVCNLDEFIQWYLENITDEMIRPNVDRIDPDKNYELGNMQLLSAKENAQKTFRQNPAIKTKLNNMTKANEKRSKKISVNGMIFDSIRDASRNFKICPTVISKYMKRNKTKKIIIKNVSVKRIFNDE